MKYSDEEQAVKLLRELAAWATTADVPLQNMNTAFGLTGLQHLPISFVPALLVEEIREFLQDIGASQ